MWYIKQKASVVSDILPAPWSHAKVGWTMVAYEDQNIEQSKDKM